MRSKGRPRPRTARGAAGSGSDDSDADRDPEPEGEVGRKLTWVPSDGADAVAADDVLEERAGDGGCRLVLEGDHLGPAGERVDDSEDLRVPLV